MFEGRDSYKYACPVSQSGVNDIGLYGMTGNVWEWCSDWYGTYSSGSQTNPTGISNGSLRVYRGGGWRGDAGYCRASYRNYNSPSYRNYHLGFRLSRTE
ncbi:MAG: SUMF1/EgtB/PvdO family nonheme iron enzyme [Bacteroidia bacterium]|nr:SUMF1/EgtB/PvdO family nonheme iron enzyme [Bacteroidia bacterium]